MSSELAHLALSQLSWRLLTNVPREDKTSAVCLRKRTYHKSLEHVSYTHTTFEETENKHRHRAAIT